MVRFREWDKGNKIFLGSRKAVEWSWLSHRLFLLVLLCLLPDFFVLGDKDILAYMERYPQFLPLWHTLSVNWSPLVYYMCMCVGWAASVMSDSLWPYGPWPATLFCPWDSPGKNSGGGCYALLQEIFPTQGSHPSLLHLPALAGEFFAASTTWEAIFHISDD